MKKLFSTNICGITDVAEEGKVYGIYNYDLNEWLFFDAMGQPLPNYKRPPCEASIHDEQYTGDKSQISPMIDGFYGYSTGEIHYHPDGFDGHVGIKNKDGTKITEEIFAELTYFSNGLCPVRNKEGKWGCVDTTGKLVLPYLFCDAPQFNHYGVAVGDNSLIDRNGTPIPDTELDLIEDCYEQNRYYVFGLLTKEQSESISQCGSAENIRLDIYDTKLRKYVVRNIPESDLSIGNFEGEGEVILAALAMMQNYDRISVEGIGTIFAEKANIITVYDYYRN